MVRAESEGLAKDNNCCETDAAVVPQKKQESHDPDNSEGGEKLVPVGEAIRYRKRAQAAEQELAELKGCVQDIHVELEQARQTVKHLERRQKIDDLLVGADTVDVDVARLLTEAAVEMMDQPDIALAIEDLRRQKPYLFRKRRSAAGHMPARVRSKSAHDADEAAERAATTGDRHDLLRYLRLRRKP